MSKVKLADNLIIPKERFKDLLTELETEADRQLDHGNTSFGKGIVYAMEKIMGLTDEVR